ncbi:cadherin-10-like [Pollicipes pollicipes]|uniref:cadherin-10-like n=1 Tax=Pollicipes pollicipes TaxID=41117 RepID=UPI001884A243|nr:cadherin-10-like [Pollicipes pollicipes]
MRRRNRKKGYKAADTELRQTIVNFNEEGDHEQDNTKFDLSRLQLTDEQKNLPSLTSSPATSQRRRADGLQGAVAVPPPSTQDALNDKPPALDDKDGIGAQDDLRNYAYEGNDSSAGSLSSINSGTTDGDQNFDYLQELGPRFRRLADLYGDEADMSSSDGDDGPLLVPGSEPTESWC